MTQEIDEFTRLDRELNGVSNALYDVDDEIKTACQNDKEVTKKIEDTYQAICNLQQAIVEYKKRKENEGETI